MIKYISVDVDVNESYQVDIPVENILNCIKANDIIDLIDFTDDKIKRQLLNKLNIDTAFDYNLEGQELYRLLCNICDVSYHTSKKKLLNLLTDKF